MAQQERVRDMLVQPPAERLILLGARGSASEMVQWSERMWLTSQDTYLARLLSADRQLGLLRAALAFAEERGRSERCPPPVPRETVRVSSSDDPIQIVHLDGSQYELRTPPLRANPDFERTVATMVCPAATAGWIDADGNRVDVQDTDDADGIESEAPAEP